jgi:hypothetical protein
MRYSSHSFSTSALDEGEWSASRPSRALLPGKGLPVRILQKAWWDPEPVWTQRLKESLLPLPWIESLSPGRPARSQTLYWLSYPLTLYLAVDIFMCSNNVAAVKRKCCAWWCEDGCHKVRVFVDAPGWWDAVPARGYFRYASTVKSVSAFGQSSLEPPVYINN